MTGRQKLLSICPKNSICAEIGVWMGNFSQEILDAVKPKLLYLIDPWSDNIAGVEDRKYFIANENIVKRFGSMAGIYNSVVKRFCNIDNVVVCKSASQDKVGDFTDSYFDFVYIDGCHTYDQALKDITLYWPKVKVGGILSGDDYDWGECFDFPVKRAIEKFFKPLGIQVTISENQWWAIRK